MNNKSAFLLLRPVLLIALTLTIPAFYLILTGPGSPVGKRFGSVFYAVAALLVLIDVLVQQRHWLRHGRSRWLASAWGLVLFGGALASAWPGAPSWSVMEWVLRLVFCAIVFLRLSQLLASWVGPHHLLQILLIGAVSLALAGGGFYWLEPRVTIYADGLWLAFITGATVGYGDLVPSTPASRIFSVFIVLLGYALFSVVTASIAALFIGEDEKGAQQRLHADILALRAEIVALRQELHGSGSP